MRLERSAGSPALFTVNNRPHPAQIIQFYTQKSKQDLLLICLILKQILILASDSLQLPQNCALAVDDGISRIHHPG